MSALLIFLTALRHCSLTACVAFFDLGRLPTLVVRPSATLAVENLFLRKQLTLFQERQFKPQRAQDAARWLMATLSRVFDWRTALVVVKPNTLIRWHSNGWRLFWRWKLKPPGRPSLSKDLRQLIRKMAAANLTWGVERTANELNLKLGIRVSPRTVEKCLRDGGHARTLDPKQRWLTFIHNHARMIVACDFFVVNTQRSAPCMCSCSWIWEPGAFPVTTCPPIRRLSGLCNGSGRRCRAIIRIGS
jgi:putative transposase